MVQLAIVLVGVGPEALSQALVVVPEPLALAAHARGTRVTGVWPGSGMAGLGRARQQLARWLEAAAAALGVLEVEDLLTGQPTSAELLHRPATVHAVFSARHAIVDGRIWARLFGLYALGESDVVASAEVDVPVEEVYRLLTHYAAWRLETLSAPAPTTSPTTSPLGALAPAGRAAAMAAQAAQATPADPATPGEQRPMPYGYGLIGLADHDVGDAAFWQMLRERLATEHLRAAFDDRMEAPAPMVLCEAEDLDTPDPERFVVGVTATLRVRLQQLATRARWGLAPHPTDAPCAVDAAGFCARLDVVRDVTSFFAYREPPQSPLDSGWRFGCLDPAHQHDETTLRIAPLARLGSHFPGLAAYLALPPGWLVLREEDAFWVQPPDEERALKDEAANEGAPA